MPSQLSKGTTFSDGGGPYHGADFNNLVDAGTILPGAITEQTAIGGNLSLTDQFLYYSAGLSALRKCSLQNIVNSLGISASANVTGIRKSSGAGSTDVAANNQDLVVRSSVSINQAGAVINWASSNVFYSTLTGSGTRTFTYSNQLDGQIIMITFILSGFSGSVVMQGFGTISVSGQSHLSFVVANSPGAGSIGVYTLF